MVAFKRATRSIGVKRSLELLAAVQGRDSPLMTARSRALCVVLVRSRGDHAGARAELHRLRAIDCAAITQRDPEATLN